MEDLKNKKNEKNETRDKTYAEIVRGRENQKNDEIKTDSE